MKIKQIVSVSFGESSQKKTPFIKIKCKLEDGSYANWTGWNTQKNEDNLRAYLSAFKFEGSISEVGNVMDQESRAEFFKPPSEEAVVAEKSFTNNEGELIEYKVVESLVGVGVSTKYSDSYQKKHWGSFDRGAKKETKNDIPF